ncbi:MAG: diguanylate cyclase, partial [Ruminiclostridium sp.]|nr:diguanylate cyclase [Ruminiclostridium sp.]
LQFEQNENDNNNLVSQLGRKYAQLEEAKLEKQEQYDELVKVNVRLEEANVSLNSSLAEFFTLQQVSQAISSLFDMNELLGFVNDIIIGVMGASTSNIVLYKRNRLIVQMTNIQNIREKAILTDNINNSCLREVFENGEILINNNVEPDSYEFTKGRNVKSLICVPLQVKDKVHGLLLIEHSIPEAFGDSNIRLLNIVAQQVSIAIENARLYEQLQDYANTDGLTQVYNRLFFQNYLSKELKKAIVNSSKISVIMYDIDNFKKFNDTYGHLFGDEVLKSIAQLVKRSIRKNDIIARFGGEEFIILLPHTSAKAACEKAEELRKSIESMVVQDKLMSASVTVSMGVSTFPDFAETEDSLLRSVDAALYEAKGKGKNRVEIAVS